MFPRIEHINDILPFVNTNEQIRSKVDEHSDHTVLCYMVQDEDTFAGKHEHYERECRGISFGPDGIISARTLHKFFNIGQREDVQAEKLEWSKVIRIMEKRDGSMVTPVEVDGKIKFKTKKSFSTKEAALADQVAVEKGYMNWIHKLVSCGFTPTFEITSPKYPIVVLYDEDELTLLHVRDMVTGAYLPESSLKQMDPPMPIVENLIDQFMVDGVVSWDLLKTYAETATGVEGVVIQFANADMVKLKTMWYCELHRSVTFTRWRDIAHNVVADSSDDLKGAFKLTGRSIDAILHVERNIQQTIVRVVEIINTTIEEDAALSIKDFALKHKDREYFGLLMNAKRGKSTDYYKWYENHQLDDTWTLEVVPTDFTLNP